MSQKDMQCEVAVAERCESEVHAKETLKGPRILVQTTVLIYKG